MRSDNCPTCGGTKIVRTYQDEDGNESWFSWLLSKQATKGAIEKPCPTCKDSNGIPTGRICVLSDSEIGELVVGEVSLDLAFPGHGFSFSDAINRENAHRNRKKEEEGK